MAQVVPKQKRQDTNKPFFSHKETFRLAFLRMNDGVHHEPSCLRPDEGIREEARNSRFPIVEKNRPH